MSDPVASRYLRTLAGSLGIADLDRPATHVVIEEARAGSALIVGYSFAAVAVVRAGPEHADLVAPLSDPDRARSHDELRGWARQVGWVDFDGGWSHVVDPADVRDAPLPDGFQVTKLDPRGDDNERLVSWLRAADPDDVDAGDFDVDSLDERMVAAVDAGREIVAIASSYATDEAPDFDDIGVLVAPDVRGRGVGRAVVGALLTEIHADGQRGLYRCNWSNPGSRQVALGLGFTEILSLIALCPEGDPKAAPAA